jgi:colicin import membrane protein
MSVEGASVPGPRGEGLREQIEKAERRLTAAVEAAGEAERRAIAEIQALEADLERERAESNRALEALKLSHEEALQREREAKERAIAAAEKRLGEIEAEAEAAEERIAAAERRAAESERLVADEQARAREGAAAWLQQQIETIRREAASR